jgi:hypothetical protein
MLSRSPKLAPEGDVPKRHTVMRFRAERSAKGVAPLLAMWDTMLLSYGQQDVDFKIPPPASRRGK